jgi:hypothetical protein
MYFVEMGLLQVGRELCTTTHHYKSLFNSVIIAYGQFMVFQYERNLYAGKTIIFKEENVYISVMVKCLKSC